MHSLDIIDLEEGSSPSSRVLQRAASPPADVVTSPYKEEGVLVGVQQGAGEFEQFIAEMTPRSATACDLCETPRGCRHGRADGEAVDLCPHWIQRRVWEVF